MSDLLVTGLAWLLAALALVGCVAVTVRTAATLYAALKKENRND